MSKVKEPLNLSEKIGDFTEKVALYLRLEE